MNKSWCPGPEVESSRPEIHRGRVPPADDDAHVLSGGRRVRPESRAANAAAPPGSATSRSTSQSATWARRMASSDTSTTRSTYAWAIGNISSPTRRGASESAAMLPASASTGRPARAPR